MSVIDLPTESTPDLLDLTRILIEEGSDKFHRHRYDVAYSLLFDRIRYSARSVLEVGVYKGQSLRAWQRYFQFAKVVGLDLRARPVDLPESIVYVQGDQGDRGLLNEIAAEHGPFDVIIEDGSHQMRHQVQCAQWLWPHVKLGGVYVCEDLHTSELVEREGEEGDEYRRRFNPTNEKQVAREWFLEDARQRCIRRGERYAQGSTLLGDRVVVMSTAMTAWIKVHDGQSKAWP